MNIQRTAVQVREYDKAVEMMQKVDFASLNKTVSDLVGTNISFEYEITQNEGFCPNVRIFSTKDVKDNTGFLKNSFEKVLIQDFGVKLLEVYEFDKDAIDACVKVGDWDGVNNVPQTFVSSYLELFLDARIFMKNGGSNGIHILSGKFEFDTGEWEF